MLKVFKLFCFVILVSFSMSKTTVFAAESHAGYYYPTLGSKETYKPRAPKFAEATELTRIAFVTALTKQSMSNPYAPEFVIFAKGDKSQKAIITAVGEGRFNTLYRMRGLLAMMTALARSTPMFQQSAAASELTFLDMLYMMGFTQITISDGKDEAHQIVFK